MTKEGWIDTITRITGAEEEIELSHDGLNEILHAISVHAKMDKQSFSREADFCFKLHTQYTKNHDLMVEKMKKRLKDYEQEENG